MRYRNCKFDLKCFPYGVPQVSEASPVLYIHDKDKCLDCTKCALFADDTKNFVESKTASGVYALGNQTFKLASDWFTSIELFVYKNKSICAMFHGKPK